MASLHTEGISGVLDTCLEYKCFQGRGIVSSSSRSGTRCCVPFCVNKGGHRFPKDVNLRKKWVWAVRRTGVRVTEEWMPSSWTTVCHDHFTSNDYVAETYHGCIPSKKQLKKYAVPSIFPWTKPDKPSHKQREERAAIRSKNRHEKNERKQMELDEQRRSIEDEVPMMEVEVCDELPPTNHDHHCICSLEEIVVYVPQHALPFMRIENFKNNNKAIQHYTGLENYEKFQYVFHTLGPAKYHLKYKWGSHSTLSDENKFFLTLVKLRTHPSNFELSLQFGVSEFDVSNVFFTWICFMYFQWKEIDIFPSVDLTHFFIQKDFWDKFPHTRIIIDGIEFPVMKPKNPLAQQSTFSSYKNRNTLKAVVGCTPGGLVNHIPDAYGGSASDRQLVVRSDLSKHLASHDSIMADKGFDIQDLYDISDITVNIPTFLRKRNRPNPSDVLRDRKISSKRVHIERIIGLAKTYKILCQPLVPSEIALGSQILYCCFMLCNFRNGIVSDSA